LSFIGNLLTYCDSQPNNIRWLSLKLDFYADKPTLFNFLHTLLQEAQVALGRNPEGAKEKEGDNKTPEGMYTIDTRNTKSSYHLALHISYQILKTFSVQSSKESHRAAAS